MAFSFECPHCEMGIEAEFELCGSTCTCPGCGGLFLVPEVDPAVLEQAQEGSRLSAGGAGSVAPGAEVFAELARLQGELAGAAEQRQELERELAREKARQKARVSEETSASSELKEAKAARKKAEAEAADLGRQCEDLRRRLDDAEKAALAQGQARAGAEERSKEELAATLRDLEGYQQSAKQLAREVEKLRGDLDSAGSETARLEREAAVERERASKELAELGRKLAGAEVEKKRAEEESVSRSRELDRLTAAIAAERRESAAKLERLDRALEEKEKERLEVEARAKQARAAAEQEADRRALDAQKLEQTIAEGEAKVSALEKERDEARAVARRELETLQNRVDLQQRELARSQQSASETTREVERLRADLAAVTAEKSSRERGFAEERGLLLERLERLKVERDALSEKSRLQERAEAEPDGEVQRLRKELLEARGAGATAERTLAAERTAMAHKQRALEQEQEAAEERSKSLLGELDGLRMQLEEAQRNRVSPGAPEIRGQGLSPEAEAELRQILARRDLEIQRLAAQLREVSQAAGGDSGSQGLWGGLHGKAALVLCFGTLVFGLAVGALFSRPKPGHVLLMNAPGNAPVNAPVHAPPVNTEGAPVNIAGRDPSVPASGGAGGAHTQATEPPPPKGALPSGEPNAQAGPASSKPPLPDPTQPAVASGTSMAGRAGMPSSLPDQFLGIKFGTELSQVSGISLWKETAGKRHRKAELLGSEVEAVLTADSQGRLIMGSYVRVAFRQPDSLTPFLEWAVNVQDAVSALYGEPIRVHSVEGASEAVEVVRKISAGEDYYQASWERESEDGMIDMSIRVFNERSVVFRMEYRARRLYLAYMAEQAAKDAPKDASKEESREEAAKNAAKNAAKDGGAPAKVE